MLTLLAATLGAAPASAGGGVCDSGPWGVASSAPLQDDAGTGFDAGDARERATPLPGHANYSSFLDPVYRDGRDAEDWYTLELGSSSWDVIRFSVGAGYTPGMPDLAFRMEVFEPGAATPSFSTTSRDAPIELADYSAGRWDVRVAVIDPQRVVYLCGTAAAPVAGTGLAGTTSRVVSNHMVYFGCEPVCTSTS